MAELQHYSWESPDGTVAVHLAFEALDIVNAAISEAAVAAPVKNAEVGGLLLGTSKRGAQLVVHVERVELLASRYPHGPSFHLDAQDTPDMKRPEIVGFFRSHTRKDLFLGDYDQALIAEHFPGSANVFLLVKPFKTRTNLGGFFYSQNGKVEGAASTREFPFDRRELGGGQSAPIDLPGQRIRESSLSQQTRSRQPVLIWAALGLLGLAGAGCLAYLVNQTKPSQPKPLAAVAPVAASIALTASEGEREITLKWDRQSPAIQNAAKAIVDIQEGTFHKSLTLEAEQLLHGSIVYSRPLAIADTVAFRVKLFSDRYPPLSESVQLVSSRQIRLETPPQFVLPPVQLPRSPQVAAVSTPKPMRAKAPPASTAPPIPAKTDEPVPTTLVRPAPRRIP